MPEIGWPLLVLSSTAVVLAAIVRGFAGFGFSLLSITAISLVMPARDLVASMFLLEITASLNLLPSVWRAVDWKSLAPLLLGYAVALPVGVYALATLPPLPLQIALGLFVVVTATAMLKGFQLEKTPGPAAAVAAGAGSGLMNGAFGMGGPPVVLFYFSTSTGAATGRASVIAFLFLTDILGLIALSRHDLVTARSFLQFALWLPALLIGVAIGARCFRDVDPARFRRLVLILLIGLALLTLTEASYTMLARARAPLL